MLKVPIPKKKKGEECIDIRFTYDINGILEVEVTVVSNGKKVSKILSQNMDEKEIEKRMQQLQKLKIHHFLILLKAEQQYSFQKSVSIGKKQRYCNFRTRK